MRVWPVPADQRPEVNDLHLVPVGQGRHLVADELHQLSGREAGHLIEDELHQLPGPDPNPAAGWTVHLRAAAVVALEISGRCARWPS